MGTGHLSVQRKRRTLEKLTSPKRRSGMLRQKIQKVEGHLMMHKVLLTPEKEVEEFSSKDQTFQNSLQNQGLGMQGYC
jgi:hypothetical protein